MNTRRRNVPRTAKHGKLDLPVGDNDAAPIFKIQPIKPESATKLLTLAEAAGFLTISTSGMRRLQQGRRIAFFKVGGSIRFAQSDLISFLAQQRVSVIGK